MDEKSASIGVEATDQGIWTFRRRGVLVTRPVELRGHEFAAWDFEWTFCHGCAGGLGS